MKTTITLLMAVISISGCSAYQLRQFGFRSSTITAVPTKMELLELCEVANGYRPSNQSSISVYSERARRKMSPEQCERTIKELYLSRFVQRLTNTEVKITKGKK